VHEKKKPTKKQTSNTHPFLSGLPLKVFINIPVALPLPAAGGELEAVQRLVLQTCDITPLPAVARQQALRETVNRIPTLAQKQEDNKLLEKYETQSEVWAALVCVEVGRLTCSVKDRSNIRKRSAMWWRENNR